MASGIGGRPSWRHVKYKKPQVIRLQCLRVLDPPLSLPGSQPGHEMEVHKMGRAGMVFSTIAIAAGAIMYWAVTYQGHGFRLSTVGIILMVVGAVGLVTSTIVFASSRRPAGSREPHLRPAGDRLSRWSDHSARRSALVSQALGRTRQSERKRTTRDHSVKWIATHFVAWLLANQSIRRSHARRVVH